MRLTRTINLLTQIIEATSVMYVRCRWRRLQTEDPDMTLTEDTVAQTAPATSNYAPPRLGVFDTLYGAGYVEDWQESGSSDFQGWDGGLR